MKTSKQYTEGRSLGGNLHCLIEFERLEKPVKLSAVEEEEERIRGDGGSKYRKFLSNSYQQEWDAKPSQEETKEPLQESQKVNQPE